VDQSQDCPLNNQFTIPSDYYIIQKNGKKSHDFYTAIIHNNNLGLSMSDSSVPYQIIARKNMKPLLNQA
jgi:hypothetical protein